MGLGGAGEGRHVTTSAARVPSPPHALSEPPGRRPPFPRRLIFLAAGCRQPPSGGIVPGPGMLTDRPARRRGGGGGGGGGGLGPSAARPPMPVSC